MSPGRMKRPRFWASTNWPAGTGKRSPSPETKRPRFWASADCPAGTGKQSSHDSRKDEEAQILGLSNVEANCFLFG